MSNSHEKSDPAELNEEFMKQMVSGEGSRYDIGWKIWGNAMSWIKESREIAHPLWLIWGALTDWVENRPDESELAEAEMMRAAQEWTSLNLDDKEERDAYLDRWVYDELNHERPQSP